MDLFNQFAGFWHYLLAGATLLAAGAASAHAVLYKRDPRAAVLWVGVIWLVPLAGAVLYVLLGVNRIRRRAISMGRTHERQQSLARAAGLTQWGPAEQIRSEAEQMLPLANLGDKVIQRPLLPGNRITPLLNGDEAYPAMLAAIDSATKTISLSTYIFDNDRAGKRFSSALGEAVRRGVAVRVLVDDAGSRYSWPSIFGVLRRLNISVSRFLPTFSLWRLLSLNMRTHRKILVVDGRIGFTGGMNIREGHVLGNNPSHPVQDIHFKVEGPVVCEMQEAFVEDWYFCTGELLQGPDWFPDLEAQDGVIARGISDGPDEDFEILRWIILGAISCAKRSIRIVTPYFLPDQALISALNVASMRGVEVDIILPAKSNLPYIQWASIALWWQMLERGCRFWLTPPPFDHSKLMVVDRYWVTIGSANLDPRSLRLNFEFNVECYDSALAGRLEEIISRKLKGARQVTLEEVDARGLAVRLRDGIARLFMPYL